MMQPKASENAPLTPLAELIGRAGAELADLAATIERMHPLAAAHARHAAATPDDIQALQDLDHTEQKLRALAHFLSDIAGATSADWRLDPQQALAAITLADLAARLAGQKPDNQTPTAGELELF